MAKDSVAVRIAGHEYRLRSGGDADSLREIAGYVDRAMARVRERTGTVDTIDVAILTCLNLAREILSLHEGQVPSGATAIDEEKLRSLIDRVESSLGQAPTISGEASDRSSDDAGDSEAESPDQDTGDQDARVEVEPRTLELPSVEALRDRASSRQTEASAATEADALPEQRAASGGRDRAS